jgi:hypothetical protein
MASRRLFIDLFIDGVVYILIYKLMAAAAQKRAK